MKKRIDSITKIAVAMRRHRTGFFSAYTSYLWGNKFSRVGIKDDLELFGLDGSYMTKGGRKPRYYEE